MLTLTPVGTNSTGTATIQTATLYEDGKVIASARSPRPRSRPPGTPPSSATGPDGDFTGSIADVSLYTTALVGRPTSPRTTTGCTTRCWSQEPGSNPALPTYLATPTLNTQTITVTDPFGKNASYVYASGELVKTTDVLGGVTWYGYDASDRATTATDPDGYTTYTTHDAYNNVTSTTTCAAINDCQTSYESYYENLSNPLDPRNNKPTDERDARSSSPSDPAYDTVTSLHRLGRDGVEDHPADHGVPVRVQDDVHATPPGPRAAVGGGTEPAGLLASTTSPNGGVTKYAYDSAGDVAR